MVRFIGAIALVLSLAGYFSYLVNVKKISIFIAPSVIITSICTTIFPVNSCQMELHRVYYLCSCPFGGCELGDGGFFVRETPFPFFALPPVMREGLPLYALLPAMRERLPLYALLPVMCKGSPHGIPQGNIWWMSLGSGNGCSRIAVHTGALCASPSHHLLCCALFEHIADGAVSQYSAGSFYRI